MRYHGGMGYRGGMDEVLWKDGWVIVGGWGTVGNGWGTVGGWMG